VRFSRRLFVPSWTDFHDRRSSFSGACLILVALLATPSRLTPAEAWSPPLGIPAPSFGIAEAAPPAPDPWSTPTPGFYYVEPSHPSATDSGNPLGMPSLPRATVPVRLPAGAVVEVRGVYGLAHRSAEGITALGTPSRPVFIRGAAATQRPVLTQGWEIHGSYLILENLEFVVTEESKTAIVFLGPVDHVALRSSDISGRVTGSGAGAWGTGGGNATQVVFYANVIHDNVDARAALDQDVHGIIVGDRVQQIWILDNEIYRNSGNGVHIDAGRSPQATTHQVYVGRNTAHQNGRNGFWTKQAVDVILSQNLSYSHRPGESSAGAGMGFEDASDRVWFLFNHIHDCDYGIFASSDGGESYLIGNLIHDIRHSGSYDPSSAWSSAGILLAGATNSYVVNNTIHDVDAGIHSPASRGSLQLLNNVISGLGGAGGSHIFIDHAETASRSSMSHHLMGGTVTIRWGDATAYDLVGFQAVFLGKGQGSFNADPLFVDAPGEDFRLQEGSPAVNAGLDDAVYGLFAQLYGVVIAVDADGRSRPQGPAFDVGVYELTGDVVPEISIDDVTAAEGESGAVDLVFNVSLSRPSTPPVTVGYATTDGTATAGSDYTATTGTIDFIGASTLETITVAVEGDTIPEGDETFLVNLSAATNGTIADGQGRGTINDDDVAELTLSIRDAVVTEGDSGTAQAVFPVDLSGPASTGVSVDYATADGLATAGSDYVATAGSLSLAPGATTGTIGVIVKGDITPEGDETFFVSLSGAAGAALAEAQGQGTIHDNDHQPVATDADRRARPALRIRSESPPGLEAARGTQSSQILASSAAPTPAGLSALTYEYDVIAIEPPPDREGSKAHGINNSGQVSGRFHNYDPVQERDADRQAFFWDPSGGAVVLPTLSGDSSAWGLNDNGVVSGYSRNASGYERAAAWDSQETPISIVDIGALTNTTTGVSGDTSSAYDLNNLAQITGLADIPNDAGDFTPFHAFLYDEASGIQDLGTFDTLYPQWQNGYSISYSANESGQVVGIAHNSSWQFRPFIWDSVNALQELPRDLAYPASEWYAVAINDSGLIGGHVIAAVDQSLPYYWPDPSSDPIAITMPAAFPSGETYAVNAAGELVGIMWDATGLEHAFVFDTTNGLRDLNDLIGPTAGWVLGYARDINDSGQIVGSGELDGANRAFVLTPATASSGWISGVVRDATTGAPLEGVRVRVHDSTDLFVTQQQTDTAGSYTSALLPAGSYFATTSNDLGYVDELFDDIPCTGCSPIPGLPILVSERVGTPGVDFALRHTQQPPGTVYEDAEDGATSGWIVYDDDPPGASISSVFDDARQSQVVQLSGSGTANGYRLRNDDGSPWHNATQRVIEWSMAYSEDFTVYVDVETTAGQRFLYYTPEDTDRLGTQRYVHHGLGSGVIDGLWHTFFRDLETDLEQAQPGESVLEVNGLFIRGSGKVDDVRLWSAMPAVTYEDAEDGTTSGWVVYDDDPPGALITNVFDGVRQSQVVQLSGSGTANGYRLRNDDGSPWQNTAQRVLEWSMAYSENFTVYVDVETTAGQRFLYYTPVDSDRLGTQRYVHHGLGSGVIDGLWRTFFRDLQADLEQAQPGESVLEVNGLFIRGSGKVDDVILWSAMPAVTYEDAEDGTTSGWVVYDDDPPGALISNVFDGVRQSQVMQLSGSGTGNGYRLRNDDGSPWHNDTQRVIEWSMAYSEDFTVYVDVETTAGQRFLYYTPMDTDRLGTQRYVHHGLGSNVIDGLWRTVVRDLQADLEQAQPGESILEVNGFFIRGSGRVDDVRLRSQ